MQNNINKQSYFKANANSSWLATKKQARVISISRTLRYTFHRKGYRCSSRLNSIALKHMSIKLGILLLYYPCHYCSVDQSYITRTGCID